MGEKVFKKRFAVDLAKELGISVSSAENFINKFIGLLYSELKAGNTVVFSGFGKFYPYKSQKTVAVNPKTGEKISIVPKSRIKFKQSNSIELD